MIADHHRKWRYQRLLREIVRGVTVGVLLLEISLYVMFFVGVGNSVLLRIMHHGTGYMLFTNLLTFLFSGFVGLWGSVDTKIEEENSQPAVQWCAYANLIAVIILPLITPAVAFAR